MIGGIKIIETDDGNTAISNSLSEFYFQLEAAKTVETTET
jgi:hypothetical protein